MVITKINQYLDGGTFEIESDDGIWYIDNRIGSKTKGRIFGDYPNDIMSPLPEEFKYKILGSLYINNTEIFYKAIAKLLV